MAIPHGGGKRFEAIRWSIEIIEEWIARRRASARCQDVAIRGLEVFPAAAVLAPEAGTAARGSRAYSDGHTEDVTRWAKLRFEQ